eukprot:gene4906-5150_t
MSLGYASRLSHREDLGGRLGDPELFDPPHLLLDKARKLADLVQQANKIIAFTGAGISTAAGIPDFRGPQGVWTLQRKGLPLPKLHTSFVYAKPSLTHQALLGLLQSGKLQYICSQNVDSLHLRSGVPRYQLAELHGNCFAERCQKCKREYVRDFEMDTVGFKPTGRSCDKPGCSGRLADFILDWEDALPAAELKATQQHASTSIIPAANLPLRTVKAGGKLAIINLQGTPKDNKAEVVLHGKVDEVRMTHPEGAVVGQQGGLWEVAAAAAMAPRRQRDSQDEQMADSDGPSREASSEQADDPDSDIDYVGGDSNHEEGGEAGGRRSSDRPCKRTRVFDV